MNEKEKKLTLDDFDFGLLDHHMTVKSKLESKVEKGDISKERAEELYRKWLKKRNADVKEATE